MKSMTPSAYTSVHWPHSYAKRRDNHVRPPEASHVVRTSLAKCAGAGVRTSIPVKVENFIGPDGHIQ